MSSGRRVRRWGAWLGGGALVAAGLAGVPVQASMAAAGDPVLTVPDIALVEGDSGTTAFDFVVTLSVPAPSGGVTFDLATADGDATSASGDYVPVSLTGQVIAEGSDTYVATVLVNGDTNIETVENFYLNVTNVTAGVDVVDGQGVGIIQADDFVADLASSVTVNGTTYTSGPYVNSVTAQVGDPFAASWRVTNLGPATATSASGVWAIGSGAPPPVDCGPSGPSGTGGFLVPGQSASDSFLPGPDCTLTTPGIYTFGITTNADSDDPDGGNDTTEVTVTVESAGWAFSGFAQPVDAPPAVNTMRAGAAVPVKFGLGGDQGLSIFAPGYPKSNRVSCDTGADLDPVEETVSAGGSSLSYDPVTDQYTYVWKSDRAWKGTCRQLTVEFADGSVHTAQFRLK